MRRALTAALVASLALALAGCGGSSSDSSSGGSSDGSGLKVSAASSLKAAFPKYEPDAAYSFAGSDELAAQIKAGAKPDVFASASTSLPDDLYRSGLVEKPVVFASNRLVVAVPTSDPSIKSLDDLAKPGVKIAAGSESVPIGSYTREVLGRLPADEAKAIEANIASNEPDVSGIVGKLTQGAVDAGFVYVTDVAATSGDLTAIELPAELQPKVDYAAAVVKGANNADAARKFVNGLLSEKGIGALTDAGFKAARQPK
jgi:molybdate transport system substrate-binding protein